MNPSEPQPVYVLHNRPWKESSLMVDVLSLDFGRLRLIARGAKRKNGSAHLLQAFQPLLLTWTGRSELKTLISCEAGQRLPLLSGNKMLSGLYVNELILKLCPLHQKVEDIFFSYAKLLNDMHDDLNQTLRVFELNFLSTLGLLPDLHQDCYGKALQTGHLYNVHPVDGVNPSTHSGENMYSAEL
ncbi:MAG: DNA repair protein RecO, partial [bacterium]